MHVDGNRGRLRPIQALIRAGYRVYVWTVLQLVATESKSTFLRTCSRCRTGLRDASRKPVGMHGVLGERRISLSLDPSSDRLIHSSQPGAKSASSTALWVAHFKKRFSPRALVDACELASSRTPTRRCVYRRAILSLWIYDRHTTETGAHSNRPRTRASTCLGSSGRCDERRALDAVTTPDTGRYRTLRGYHMAAGIPQDTGTTRRSRACRARPVRPIAHGRTRRPVGMHFPAKEKG